MRNYLVEVHGTLLQTLVNLMNDYSTNLLLYKDGYYQIDSSNHAKLPGQVFTTLHSDLKSSRDNLKSEIEFLNTTKDKISDLVSYSGSSHTSTVMNYNFLMNQVKNLDNSIIQYESNHASQDLVAFKELLSATKALIAEHAGKTRTVGTYQSGDFAKLQSVQRFAMAYQQVSKQMESRVERVQAAQERDKVRFEALAAEDRAKNGWKDLAIGVVTVAIGALAIWATMGAATPLVVGAGLTAGIGTAAYGASNAGEGIHNIQLGLNKSPLVSRELPKVKGVHDVEAPKYNREQILKNLEESKLARESSNFDQYLAKEKLQLGLNKSPLVSRELPRVKGTANPSPSQSTTREIIDQKLKEYGVSWDEFNRLRNTRITEMSQYEYDMMIDIRKSIPNPTEQTVLQKIIPVKDADNYFGSKGWGVGGFISKRGDVVDIKTIEDAVNGLRLDYENSPFVETMIDANGNRVAVRDQNGNLKLKTDAFVRIEFRTHDTDYIDIPIGNRDGTKLEADPASGNGFIKSDEYLIPEYKIVKPDTKFPSVKLTDGSKMYLNVGGEEVLVGVVKNGKMYYVEE